LFVFAVFLGIRGRPTDISHSSKITLNPASDIDVPRAGCFPFNASRAAAPRARTKGDEQSLDSWGDGLTAIRAHGR